MVQNHDDSFKKFSRSKYIGMNYRGFIEEIFCSFQQEETDINLSFACDPDHG